jgi:hypothetical protein
MAKWRCVDRTSASSLAGNIEFLFQAWAAIAWPPGVDWSSIWCSELRYWPRWPCIQRNRKDLVSRRYNRIWIPEQILEDFRAIISAWNPSIFEAQCMSLKALALTFDEVGLFILGTKCYFSENFQGLEHKLLFYCNNYLNLRWRATPGSTHGTPKMTSFRIPVRNFYIRGAAPLKRVDEINPLTQEATNWLSTTKFNPKKVTFSGPFKEPSTRLYRRLMMQSTWH